MLDFVFRFGLWVGCFVGWAWICMRSRALVGLDFGGFVGRRFRFGGAIFVVCCILGFGFCKCGVGMLYSCGLV